MAGDGFDKRLHEGVLKAMKDHPSYKAVGEVYGQWTATVAQKEVAGVLPSLPKVDAVLTQGGDGYGAAQAFKAAGRDIPIIIMGNREDELSLWKQLHDGGTSNLLARRNAQGLAGRLLGRAADPRRQSSAEIR